MKTLHDPLVIHDHVNDAVVDASLPPLPELDAIRAKAEASEVRRARHVPHRAELVLHLIERPLKKIQRAGGLGSKGGLVSKMETRYNL